MHLLINTGTSTALEGGAVSRGEGVLEKHRCSLSLDRADKGAAALARGRLPPYLPGAQPCSVLGESRLSQGTKCSPASINTI